MVAVKKARVQELSELFGTVSDSEKAVMGSTVCEAMEKCKAFDEKPHRVIDDDVFEKIHIEAFEHGSYFDRIKLVVFHFTVAHKDFTMEVIAPTFDPQEYKFAVNFAYKDGLGCPHSKSKGIVTGQFKLGTTIMKELVIKVSAR